MKKIYEVNRQNVRKETWAWIESCLGIMPGKIGNIFRGLSYGLFFDNFRQKGITIGQFTHIWFPWNLRIGYYSHIGKNVQISCIKHGDLIIGKNVMVSPYVIITATIHNFHDLVTPMQLQGKTSKSIIIEDDVWIGGKSVILPGVKISRGSLVGAGSVVTKSVPPFAIVCGNPAQIVKYRNHYANSIKV